VQVAQLVVQALLEPFLQLERLVRLAEIPQSQPTTPTPLLLECF
jgi:hypothetical protein